MSPSPRPHASLVPVSRDTVLRATAAILDTVLRQRVAEKELAIQLAQRILHTWSWRWPFRRPISIERVLDLVDRQHDRSAQTHSPYTDWQTIQEGLYNWALHLGDSAKACTPKEMMWLTVTDASALAKYMPQDSGPCDKGKQCTCRSGTKGKTRRRS